MEQRSDRTLKSRIYRAGGWSLGGYAASLALRFGSTLVLTRMFAPEVYGIMAVTAAVHMTIGALSDIGLNQAIIRSPNGQSSVFLNTAWTLQLARGIWVWGASIIGAIIVHLIALSGWIPANSVYASTILPPLIIASSFSSVIRGLQSMKIVTASRNLDQKRLVLVELISQLAGFVTTLFLGWFTRSIWSFVGGNLAAVTTSTLLSHILFQGPKDRFEWNSEALHELMFFGKWVFLTSIIGALTTNGDRLLLGIWADPAMLGYYSIASNLATIVGGAANRIFGAITLPALSEVIRQRPEQLAKIYNRLRWVVDVAMIASAGFLWATGTFLIELLYDPRYSGAGPILQWLSCGLLFDRYGLAQSAWLALGHPRYMAVVNMLRTVFLFGCVPILYNLFGIEGAIMGIAFHSMPAWISVFWFNGMHGLNNIKLELSVASAWPIGWLTGVGVVHLAHSSTAIWSSIHL
jgi:O-antigen/teichoic acid export membrane protein